MADLEKNAVRILPLSDSTDKEGKLIRRQQRVWLENAPSGTYTVTLKNAAGKVVKTLSLPIEAPDGGSVAVEVRIQAYPVSKVEAP